MTVTTLFLFPLFYGDLSPPICTHRKALFPKVGSGRDAPYLQEADAKYMYVHTYECVGKGQLMRESPKHRTDTLFRGWSWGNERGGMDSCISLFSREELL